MWPQAAYACCTDRLLQLAYRSQLVELASQLHEAGVEGGIARNFLANLNDRVYRLLPIIPQHDLYGVPNGGCVGSQGAANGLHKFRHVHADLRITFTNKPNKTSREAWAIPRRASMM